MAYRQIMPDPTGGKSTLVLVMDWCRQATSHYLSQCCPRFMWPYGVGQAKWFKRIHTQWYSSKGKYSNPHVWSKVCYSSEWCALSRITCVWKLVQTFVSLIRYMAKCICKLVCEVLGITAEIIPIETGADDFSYISDYVDFWETHQNVRSWNLRHVKLNCFDLF